MILRLRCWLLNLMSALWHGSDGEDASLGTATVFEREREGDAVSGRFPAMDVDVASVSGHAVGVGVVHGNQEALNTKDKLSILLMPIVTPPGYGYEVLAVQFHSKVSLLVGFPISLQLFDGADPVPHIIQSGVPFELASSRSVRSFGYDELE